MNFAVIIPSRNIDNLQPCMDAVVMHEPEARIIVVDDGIGLAWSPHAYDPAKPGGLRALVIRGGKPFIFARNVNLGIRTAMEHFGPQDGYVLLNDDALLETPGGFTLLAEACAVHPEYGLIAATTNVTGQPEQWRRDPSDPDYGLREVRENIPFIAVYIPHRTIAQLAFNGTASVQAGVSIDPAPGLLDERYCLDYGCEDNDYNEAVRRAGLKTGVHDGCYVDHGSLKSSFRGDPDTPKTFAQNYELFLAKCKHCDETGESFVAGAGLPQPQEARA